MDYLVTYDIDTSDSAGERRLSAVAKVCESYGVRVQKSVFECRLDSVMLRRLRVALLDAMDVTKDSVRLYRLGPQARDVLTMLGRSTGRALGDTWIV